MQKTSVYSILLPQFYRTSYNDEWWGEGYTDWVAARNAKPLFRGHRQPKLPLEGEYDQSKPETLEWQADLARKYGIDGFAFYHYYSLGSHLLEKPMEVLLAHPEINMPYFVYWANEDWRKNWYGGSQKMLWRQEYGNERDWRDHFDYLLPFFRDERYVKFDNRPLFVVYRPQDLIVFHEMARVWNALARENGFDGIYFIATSPGFFHETIDEVEDAQYQAIYYREPSYFKASWKSDYGARFRQLLDQTLLSKVDRQVIMDPEDYDKVWRYILDEDIRTDKDAVLGAFPSFDNSARRGYLSQVMMHDGPEKFEKYLFAQLKRAVDVGARAVLINAWNEWGEGNHLEPDGHFGYGYLEAVKSAVNDAFPAQEGVIIDA